MLFDITVTHFKTQDMINFEAYDNLDFLLIEFRVAICLKAHTTNLHNGLRKIRAISRDFIAVDQAILIWCVWVNY